MYDKLGKYGSRVLTEETTYEPKAPNFFMTGVRPSQRDKRDSITSDQRNKSELLNKSEIIYKQLLDQEQKRRKAINKDKFYLSKNDADFKNLNKK